MQVGLENQIYLQLPRSVVMLSIDSNSTWALSALIGRLGRTVTPDLIQMRVNLFDDVVALCALQQTSPWTHDCHLTKLT